MKKYLVRQAYKPNNKHIKKKKKKKHFAIVHYVIFSMYACMYYTGRFS